MNNTVSRRQRGAARRGASTVDIILHTTILAIGMIVGLSTFRDQLVQYMGDTAAGLHALNQSFSLSVTINGNPPQTFEFDDTDNDDAEVQCLNETPAGTPPAGIQFVNGNGE